MNKILVKAIEIITRLILAMVVAGLVSMLGGMWFVLGNNSAMVLPVFEKLGIAGLGYWQYVIGAWILNGIVTFIFSGLRDK